MLRKPSNFGDIVAAAAVSLPPSAVDGCERWKDEWGKDGKMKCSDMEKNHGDIKSHEGLVLNGEKSDLAL